MAAFFAHARLTALRDSHHVLTDLFMVKKTIVTLMTSGPFDVMRSFSIQTLLLCQPCTELNATNQHAVRIEMTGIMFTTFTILA